MNKKFLSAVLFGALMVTSTGTFVSCKDYDDDIENLQTQIDANSDAIKALQAKIESGLWVTSVNSITGGFKIAFSDGQSYDIVSGKDGKDGKDGQDGAAGAAGADGAAGTKITIEDGYWCFDGVKSEYKAVADAETATKVKAPYVSAEDGYWYFYNEEGEAEKSSYKALGAAYAVEANGVYTLYMPNADGTQMAAVKLPTAGSTIQDVELLGVASVAKADANLSTIGMEEVNVDYAFVAKIVEVNDARQEDKKVWTAQKTVKTGQVLTTLAPEKKAVVARINAAADASDMIFALKNSKGETLPVALGVAAQYNGLLSRGAAGLYTLALDNTAEVYKDADAYTKKYSEGLYALVEQSGFVSNYNLKVNANPARVVEGMVAKVDGKTEVGMENNNPVFEVDLNKDLKVAFDTRNDKYVYDYYVEPVDKTLAGLFGFSANKAKGTFRVTTLADKITTTTFELKVYKLHINGKIYEETIAIKPIRTLGQATTYNLGNQLIKSGMKMNVNLADMFNNLGADAEIWKNATLGAHSAVATVKVGDDVFTDVTYIYKDKNGNATVNIYDATSIDINVAPVAGGNATLKVDKEYVATIKFKDANVKELNTITVKFTPVMPKLADYIAKREAVWANGILMAYYNDPASTTSSILASTYNLANGFTKLGGNNDVTINLVLDPKQKINDKVVMGNMATIAGNAITLHEFAINGTTKKWAYAEELNVLLDASYLDVYEFGEEEVAAQAFKVKVQSALVAGKIVPASGASIKLPAAAAGEYAKLTSDMITGYTYNNQPYSLFKAADGKFKYTYIQKVEFESVDTVLYTVGKTVDATSKTNAYVEIFSGNISQTTETKIRVKVTDWFGNVKTETLPLTITVGE